MKFTNKDELIKQAIKDGACDSGIEFAKSCKDLQEIFNNIDNNMLFWCLTNGYDQFADRYDFEKLDGFDWSRLLSRQPQFADRCDFEKLDGYEWSWLLSRQPQFADRCDWYKFSGWDWIRLLRHQPQFADRCDFEKLDYDDLDFLLKSQPQFAKYKK